ncbi:MAG: GntR family transcriptional regulator [Treponema sp.]|jgi:DNA-binding LacI/PurR family transcriptional regulator|nr:GntR family transcriptional regulator [Treponema sp.]
MDNVDVEDGYSQNPGLQKDTSPKYRKIYDYILAEISSGKLKPGDLIPTEKELSSVFGVSRITSKKALEMLVGNRLITRQRGKGSFVKGTPAVTQKNTSLFRSIAFLISAFNDSFGNRLLCSVEAACEALDYHLIVKLTNESQDEEERALRAMEDKNVAGILMVPVHGEHYNAEILRQILSKRPLVFVDRKMRGLPVPSVSTDCIAASETAVRSLLRQGHRNIAFYSGFVVHTSTVEDRRQGFVNAFAGSGVPLNPEYICDTLPSLNSLDMIASHLCAHPELSAAFTAEFEIALLVKKALAAQGRQIPHDFSLVTFDYPAYAAEFPGFVCLQQDEEAIGRQAVETLNRIIQGEAGQFIGDIQIPAKIVWESDSEKSSNINVISNLNK